MEQQANPVLERVAQSAIQSGARALGWAIRCLTRLLFARPIVAVLVIIAWLIVAIYALWIGAILWLFTGRYGIARSGRRRTQTEVGVAIVSITALVVLCAHSGRSPLNLAAITSCATAGAIVWLERRTTLQALRIELHMLHSQQPHRDPELCTTHDRTVLAPLLPPPHEKRP